MNASILRNDILTKGAILGAVMLLSHIAELSMIYYGHSLFWTIFSFFEWLLVVALYIILVYFFTRSFANKVIALRKEEPYFTYKNGLSYIVMISMLAGVIVGIGDYVYMHCVIGYENYITANIALAHETFQTTGTAMPDIIREMLLILQDQPEPSIIETLIGCLWNYMIAGTFVGAIVAIVTQRKAKLS